MYADFTSLIRAGRVIECNVAPQLDTATTGKPFSIFIAPLSNALEVGDIAVVSCDLPYEHATKVPVVVGDWSPVIFEEITQISTLTDNTPLVPETDFRLWFAPIEINER